MTNEEADLLNDICAHLEENDSNPAPEILVALAALSFDGKEEFVRWMDQRLGFGGMFPHSPGAAGLH